MIVALVIVCIAETWRGFTGPSFTKWHAFADAVISGSFAMDLFHRRAKEGPVFHELSAVACVGLVLFVLIAAISKQ
jgi:hypothetical protein